MAEAILSFAEPPHCVLDGVISVEGGLMSSTWIDLWIVMIREKISGQRTYYMKILLRRKPKRAER